ncbi:UNVERIFIED_CONTAM: Phosphatidylinositol 4-kinase beta 1 [Sesamum indicum]
MVAGSFFAIKGGKRRFTVGQYFSLETSGVRETMYLLDKSMSLVDLLNMNLFSLILGILLQDSDFPCFKGGPRTIQNLRKRFHLSLTEEQCVSLVLSLISSSLDAWRTRQMQLIQTEVLCGGLADGSFSGGVTIFLLAFSLCFKEEIQLPGMQFLSLRRVSTL